MTVDQLKQIRERIETFKEKKREFEKKYKYTQIDQTQETQEEKKHRGEILELADYTNVFLWSANFFLAALDEKDKKIEELIEWLINERKDARDKRLSYLSSCERQRICAAWQNAYEEVLKKLKEP